MAERNYLSIGQVVNLLRGAYPDLSNSKIRFLEDEGLITPHRTPKGYRQYSKEDVDRLEVILHLQKTRYMPLNVIKQRLENATDLSTLAYEVGLLSDVPLKTEPKETKQKLHPIETIPDMLGVEISFIRLARRKRPHSHHQKPAEPRARRWSRFSDHPLLLRAVALPYRATQPASVRVFR